jgi:molybdopterin-containing oxidoreductase family iron-sulfur binding subunit
MEKCSMCIQMTQATILKLLKAAVNTDEFETACSSAWNNLSITFGMLTTKR